MGKKSEGTLTVKVPGFPEPLAFGDWVHDALWGTISVPTAQTAALRGLQATVSEQKPGASAGTLLSERETNLPGPGNSGLPSAWAALVYSIQLVIAPGANLAVGDMRDLHAKALFRFKISTKTYSEGPLYRFPAAGGIEGFTTANATTWINNSGSSPASRRGFVIPHYLKPNVSFAGEVSFESSTSLAATDDVEIVLEGLIKRPVL